MGWDGVGWVWVGGRSYRKGAGSPQSKQGLLAAVVVVSVVLVDVMGGGCLGSVGGWVGRREEACVPQWEGREAGGRLRRRRENVA